MSGLTHSFLSERGIMNFLDKLTEIALPVIERCGCESADAEYVKEGADKILRFYVEKPQGAVSLEDCVNVNREISEVIDNLDFVPEEPFVLEVSSPGVNRVLKKEKDYVRFAGSEVDLSLYSAVDNQKKFSCKLLGYENGVFSFETEGRRFEIPKDNVAKINLHFDFKF